MVHFFFLFQKIVLVLLIDALTIASFGTSYFDLSSLFCSHLLHRYNAEVTNASFIFLCLFFVYKRLKKVISSLRCAFYFFTTCFAVRLSSFPFMEERSCTRCFIWDTAFTSCCCPFFSMILNSGVYFTFFVVL